MKMMGEHGRGWIGENIFAWVAQVMMAGPVQLMRFNLPTI
jgi:hypothetical protein